MLRVTLDGEVSQVLAFDNIVPTGLAKSGSTVYMAEAGPIPHQAQDGKVVSFGSKSPTATEVASGASLLVDVEFGRGRRLYALSQGDWPAADGAGPGSPATPNTGALVKVNGDGAFTVIMDGLNQPTSLEFIGSTAYVVTLPGEILEDRRRLAATLRPGALRTWGLKPGAALQQSRILCWLRPPLPVHSRNRALQQHSTPVADRQPSATARCSASCAQAFKLLPWAVASAAARGWSALH